MTTDKAPTVPELIAWAETTKHPGCDCRSCKMRPHIAEALRRLQTAADDSRKHVDQARRDLRQALDIIESGRDDSEAFRVVRLRIYEAGKQLAAAC